MSIRNAVVSLRKRLQLSQLRLAQGSGLSGGSVARLEVYDDVPPGPKALSLLADYARSHGCLDIAEFLDGELMTRHGVITPGRLNAALAAKAAQDQRTAA
jgi:hypothetical protein